MSAKQGREPNRDSFDDCFEEELLEIEVDFYSGGCRLPSARKLRELSMMKDYEQDHIFELLVCFRTAINEELGGVALDDPGLWEINELLGFEWEAEQESPGGSQEKENEPPF